MEWAGMAIPFSSPFVMLARAAQEPALWPHALALGWQLMWVGLSIRFGSALFRRRVMQSGPQAKRGRLFRRAKVAPRASLS
jgi:ABC-2 type transport system permease protein